MDIREYVYNEEEIQDLYSAVGWKAYTDNMDALRDGFADSLLVLAAYEDGKLLGIIRSLGFTEFSAIGCTGFMRYR